MANLSINNKELLNETIEFLKLVRPLCKQADYDGHYTNIRGELEKQCNLLIERLDTITND